MARVTVVIPTRNRAALLTRALHSALRQTFDNLEVVVVDDASTDSTRETVASFQDDRLRYFHHTVTKGASAARNKAIRNATGSLLAFLDDDDEWLEDKLQLQINLLDELPPEVGCIYTGHEFFTSSTEKPIGLWTPHFRGDLRRRLLDGNCVSTTSSVLVRRSLLERSGHFDEQLPSMQDYDLWLRLSRFCLFDFIKAPLVRYRIHAHRISTSADNVVTGLQRLLEKHGRPAPLKRTCGRLLLGVAVRYADAGRIRDARKLFAQSILLNPLGPHGYCYYFFSVFGTPGYSSLQTFRRALSASRRPVP